MEKPKVITNNSYYVQKRGLVSFVSFVVSPIFLFIVVLNNVFHKNKFSTYLISIFIGTLSFVYIPFSSDDRTRHFERFLEIANLNSIADFFRYVADNGLPDFFVYFTMYLLSFLTSDPRWLFFITTSFTAFSFIYVFIKVNPKIFLLKKEGFILSFLILIAVFPYIASFSGLRFTTAVGFVSFGGYFLIYKKKKILGILFLLLAVFSHFASSVLVLALITLSLFPKINYLIIFYGSFLFTLLSGDLLFEVINYLPLGDSYLGKARDYLMFADILSTAAKSAATLKLILLFKKAWVYFFLFYVLLNKKRETLLFKMVVVIVIVRNLFGALPTILAYYDTIALVFCVFWVVNGYTTNNKRFFYPLVLYFFLNFGLEVYKNRIIFISSNFKLENVLSVSLFMQEQPKPIKPQWK